MRSYFNYISQTLLLAAHSVFSGGYVRLSLIEKRASDQREKERERENESANYGAGIRKEEERERGPS